MTRQLVQVSVLFALLAYACATPTVCTKPVPPSAALHPPCFVPDTISLGAQAYLKTHHATPRAPWNDKAAAKRVSWQDHFWQLQENMACVTFGYSCRLLPIFHRRSTSYAVEKRKEQFKMF